MSLGDWNEWGQLVLQEIKRIDERQVQVCNQLDELKTTLADNTAILDQNTKSLEVHIQGVKELQIQNELIRKEVDLRLKPIETAIIFRKDIYALGLKIVGSIAALVGFAYTVVSIIEFFRGL